jgi:ribosomal protein S18 acetylase RimI-like enzyme
MDDADFPSIERLVADEERTAIEQLIHLLRDAVAAGASLGFLPPLDDQEARAYWKTVFQEIAERTRVLLVAREAGQVIGAVQLALATQPNARHRAEVQKLLVHSNHRRRGIGRSLMLESEQAARDAGRNLLVLNTVEGEMVERQYLRLGYSIVGRIPGYAQDASGALDTVIMYKSLPLERERP